ATSIHLPVDPLMATDPADEKTSPSTLFLANPTGGVLGNLERFISRNSVLTITPSNLAIIRTIEPLTRESSKFSKTNVVDIYVAFVGTIADTNGQDDPDLGAIKGTSRGTISHFSVKSFSESFGLKVDENNKRPFLFHGLDESLLRHKYIAHIQFNRYRSEFEIEYIEQRKWQMEHLPKLPVFAHASPDEAIFQGLGYGEDACRRIEAAMGVEEEDFVPYERLTEAHLRWRANTR
ncbi:MAG: hypothetical protein AAFV29_18190, partial [Myxococcota bacterium]